MSTLVTPENAKTALITKISYRENLVSAARAFDRDGFNHLVKILGLRWNRDKRQYERQIVPARHGKALDRAAEIGRELLAAGYPVEFPDAECQRMALEGTYEEEHTRWVLARTSGEFTGWFALSWSRREDFYQEARRLSGSRYSSPNVVVPPDAFEEVADFADLNDFQLSQGALSLIEEQQEKRKNALVVNIERKPKKAKAPKSERYEVDRELLDEPFPTPDTRS